MLFFYHLDDLNDNLFSLDEKFVIQKDSLLNRYLTEIRGMRGVAAREAELKPKIDIKEIKREDVIDEITYNLNPFRLFLATQSSGLEQLAKGQQDAQEIIILFLSNLNDLKFEQLLTNRTDGKNIDQTMASEIKNSIEKIFRGHYSYTDVCDKGHLQPKSNLEAFGDLRINIFFPNETLDPEKKFTLTELLGLYFNQINELEIKYSCDKCHQNKNVRYRTTKIADLPNNLMLILRRFKQVEGKDGKFVKEKLNNAISFPVFELNMKPYLENHENKIYKLKSILIQQGDTEHGHYYGYYKSKNGKWSYEFNNDSVEANEGRIYDTAFYGYDVAKSETPYVLIYEFDSIATIEENLKDLRSKLKELKTKLQTLWEKLDALRKKLG